MENRKEVENSKDAPAPHQVSNGSQLYPTLPANQIQQSDEIIMASETPVTRRENIERQTKKWRRRFRFILCCPGSERHKEPIDDVASFLGEFSAEPKLSKSELAAGLILLAKYQEAQRNWVLKDRHQNKSEIVEFLSGVPIRKDTKFLDLSNAEDSHIINEFEYYLSYSYATFGYHLYSTEKPCEMWCCNPHLRSIFCNSDKGKHKKVLSGEATGGSNKSQHDTDSETPTIRGDNCFGINWAGSQLLLDRYNHELIHISYKSDINVVPFLVAADHAKRAIVLAIRGSARCHDAITDMNYHFDKLPIENCPDDWLGHRGNISAAVNVKTTLMKERILDRAFNCRPDLNSHNYTLVLCGHSLGAATSAILGLILRPLYPTLKAYLYSPPCGILSLPVVEYTKEFCVGLILGYDIVARVGLAQFERARYHAIWSLLKAKKSPRKVVARSLCPSACFGEDHVDYEPEQSIDLLHGVDEISLDYKNTRVPFQKTPLMLYAPGRLIHIVRNYSFRSRTQRFRNGPVYQAVWTDNRDYDRILAHKKMFSDHFPWNVSEAISKLRFKTLPGLSDALK